MVGVFVEIPYSGVVTVGDLESRDPVFASGILAPLGQDASY